MNSFISRSVLLCFGFALFAVVTGAQNPVSITMSVSPSTVSAGGKGTARITTTIGSGWKMYSITQGAGGPIPTRITLGEGPFKIAGVSGPKPKVAMDPNFQINTETYTGSATFSVGFTVDPDTVEGPQTLNVNVRYQVCNDTVCLPPKTVKLATVITVGAAKAVATAAESTINTPTPTPTPTPATNSNTNANLATNVNADVDANGDASAAISQPAANAVPVSTPAESNIKDQSIWSFIWLALGFGAVSLLMPCVFPMIPITVSYFTKYGSDSRVGAVRDAGIYAFGIILTFTGLGIALAILFGAAGINQFASNPYVNLLVTGIFLAFAFSLLGAFEISVPSSILTKLDKVTRARESGKVIGLLLMGLTFSLTSFTCTVPLVGAILVSAAQGERIYPVVGMLAFSSVFALPFFVLALAPKLMQALPRSGSWMNSVKVVMGLLEIAAALKFLSNVDMVWGWGRLTREVVIAGWAAVCVVIFFYLIKAFRFTHDSDDTRIGLIRVLNALLFATLTFYLLTGLFGARLGEIEAFLPPMNETSSTSSSGTTASGELGWITNDYQAALNQAKAENNRIFVDFTGYTCTNCRWMEANMFPNPAVKAELSKFVRVKLFTDGEGEPYESFQRMQEERFGTVALPLYALVTPDDVIVARFEGLTRDESEFVAFLQK